MGKKNSSRKTAYDIVENLDLKDKVYLVTVAYSGLGAETTRALLKANGTVIIAGRNKKLQAEFANELHEDPEIGLRDKQLDASHTMDLGDLQSVKDFAGYVNQAYDQIDCLVNNAGMMNTPYGKTKDGLEIQMGVNVIGHFLLPGSLPQ